MAPKDAGPQSSPTAADQSETGPNTIAAAAAGPTPTPTPEAATTGGPKLIRCLHPGDRFVFDRSAHDDNPHQGVVDGTWREFAATKAKDVIAAAATSGVRLLVADKES